MNLLRTWRGRLRLAVVLLTITSLGLGYATQVQANVDGEAPRFNAVDLADAVLYGEGPAASYIAGWERKPTEWTDSAVKTREAVQEAIVGDEKWSDSFAVRLQSGDAQLVDSALQDLATFTRVVADKLWGADAIDRAAEAAGAAGNGTYVYQYRVYYQFLWIYEAFAWVLYWVYGLSAEIDPGKNGSLTRELLVREISVNLALRG